MTSIEQEPDTRGMLTIRIAGDVFVCVPRDINLMTPYILLEQEDWFEDDIRFSRKLLGKGESVIDIGANYGVYTLSLAQVVGESGKVWAIDPSSATMAHLECSIARNQFRNITLIRAGLSDQVGRAYLPRETNPELGAVVVEVTEGKACDEIELLTLDECEQRYGWRDIHFIKMDAEGHESRILRGGARFLSSQSPLILYEIRAGNEINCTLVDEFAALGYRSYRLAPGLGAGVLLPVENAIESLDPYTLNLYCCKPDRADALRARGLLCGMPAQEMQQDLSGTDRWQTVIDAEPHAQNYRDIWAQHASERDRQAGWPVYRRALNHYALSRADELNMDIRAGHLRTAFGLLADLVRQDANIARLMSLVRVASEWGQRGLAVGVLRELVSILGRQSLPLATEPFLVPQPADREAGGDLPIWQARMIAEAFIRLSTHSGYFSGDAGLPLLDALQRLGDMSPEMERRRQLIRLRTGLQSRPEASAPQAGVNATNSNPEFWSE